MSEGGEGEEKLYPLILERISSMVAERKGDKLGQAAFC